MSGPLPLRLWCMATMAPALTAEAATQARVKLSPSSPNGDTSSIVNGRDHIANPGDTDLLTRRSPVDQTANKPQITLASHIHKNLDTRTLNLAHQSRIIKLALGTNRNNNHHNHYLSSGLSEGKVSTNGDIAMENGDKMTHSKIIKTISVTAANGKNGLQRATNGNTKTITSVTLQNSKVPKSTNLNSDSNTQNANNVNNNAAQSSADDGSDQSVTNVAGSSRESQATTNNTGSSRPENNNDSSHRQQHLEKRATRLLKRLRRLQAQQAVTHTRQQMMGFVTTQHRNLQSIANSNRLPDPNLLPTTDLKTELLQSEDVKNLSTASLVNLVRRLQASQITLRQRLSSNNTDSRSVLTLDEELCDDIDRTAGNLSMNLRHAESAIDSDATESSSGGESCDEMDWEECEPTKHQLPLHRRGEWKWAAERSSIASRWTWLQAQVSDLEYRIRQQNDIYRQIRAAKGQVVLGETPQPEDLMVRYRPSRTGGKKLSPIEAKIADIEKRNEMSPCNLSTLLNNIDKQSSKLTQSLGNCYSPIQASPLAATTAATATSSTAAAGAAPSVSSSVSSGKHSPAKPNGVLSPCGAQPASSSETETDSSGKKVKAGDSSTPQGLATHSPVGSPNLDATCQAARCRPVKSYRKRKLLRTFGVHHLNRKAARLSTVTCHCYPPTTSCSLCGGRYNNVQSIDQYTMPVPERVALLDHSYHAVLSFSHDTPLTAHFDTLLKSGDWQSKPSNRTLKAVPTEKRKLKLTKETGGRHGKRLSKSATAALLHSNLRHKFVDNKKLSRGRSGSLPSTPRSKLEDGRLCRTEIKRRKAASLAIALKKQRALSLPNRFKTLTPSPTPLDTSSSISQSCPSSTLKEMKDALRKRRGESAFDINNIVIPYSMAASTRVEKLKYKEILTPSWRDLTQENKEEDEGKTSDEPPQLPETSTAKESNDESTQGKMEQTEEAEKTSFSIGGEEEEIEDLSDDTFAVRHMKCEVAEKKRFLSFVPTNKRTGSSLNRSLSRPDSMTSLHRTESGTTTPDPISPETSMNDSLFGSMNISSPAVAPATPSPLTLSGTSVGGSTEKEYRPASFSGKLLGEDGGIVPRRSGSFSRKERLSALSTGSDCQDRSATASPVEEGPVVMPWQLRQFPLSESEYDSMIAEHEAVKLEKHVSSTSGLALRARNVSLDGAPGEDLVDPMLADTSSPMETSPVGSVIGDDPTDPEWTVAPKLQKPGIVLKLSKR
ncbi:KAT8 regulatory NSL complex subunit 1 isoform X3 [Lingula anatina]|uniref:KAT8 regulatory NSL complex subunit 1 isoform X3 n=1 Tax=Lingula anatina TaxID=7574 RepID=A0A1S3I951_LINAN|nr:KAT8 regulatory NSL complex subunit 1 isoform X3 [Lingula anatina]|eukprot:XP_013394790.1 KAT8 regulatory NSL complex subunit 1 isoform X3 [Lingula anatina]